MIEFKDLSFAYGQAAEALACAQSLEQINLSIQAGDFVLLTGPSGCGKTTLLRLINGLIPHFYQGQITGSVELDGRALKDLPLHETACVMGTVFQNPRSQFYNVDSTEELAFACENQGLKAEEIYARIDDCVARLHIEALMDKNLFHLSDGEKQRIACASVDVAKAKIVLLDEASANLDHKATLALRKMLIHFKAQGKTILAAEHRLGYLWDLADRVIILDQGRILRELTGEEKAQMSEAELSSMGLRTKQFSSSLERMLPRLQAGDECFTLTDFSFAYPGKAPIVKIQELRLALGKITAVTGPNGLGKSSFLNCLCGLERKAKGRLIYKGVSYDRKARQKLCFMVMQDTGNQFFTESVLDEVEISLPKGEAQQKERAKAFLEQVDLGPFLDRHPQSLSGGQKQRLALACALASERPILLLDEPSSGLDYGHMMEIAALLKKLSHQGHSILIVTHDLELIKACCDRQIDLTPEGS